MLYQIFTNLLNRSITASFVIITVLLIRRILYPLPKKYLYFLWLIVGIRLLCPFAISSSISLFNFIEVDITNIISMKNDSFKIKNETIEDENFFKDSSNNKPLPNNLIDKDNNSNPNIINNNINTTLSIPPKKEHANTQRNTFFKKQKNPIIKYGAILWILGMTLIFFWNFYTTICIKKQLKTAVRYQKNIYECENIPSPFVIGIFHPKIYIPFRLDKEEQNYILKHEQYHIKRKDYLIKPAAFLLVCIYWFHPLVWLSYFCMIQDMEMSCDEYVIQNMERDIRIEYSKSLLEFATNQRKITIKNLLAFGETNTRKRVKNVLNFKKHGKWIGIFAVILIAIIGITCLTNSKMEDKDIYQTSFQNIELPCNEIINSCLYDGRIYMIGSKYEKVKAKNTYTAFFYNFNLDGSDIKQTKLDFTETKLVQYMGIDQEKNLRLITTNKKQTFLHTMNKEGTIINTCKLQPKDSKYFYVESALIAEDTLYTSYKKSIYTFDMKGNLKKVYNFGNNISEMTFTEKGQFYVYGYNGNGSNNDNFFIKELNIETGQIGNPINLNNYRIHNATLCTSKNNLYMNDSNNVYCFNTETLETALLFNWINSDINSNNIKNYFPINEKNFLVLSGSYKNESNTLSVEIASLKKVKASTIKEKTILKLSCANTSHQVKQKITSFNKENKDYRIELTDYSHYENPAIQLSLDINSGKIPDILCIESLPVSQYIQKGLLTDLYPFMEKDSEVRKEDFIESILKSVEVDEKLYFMGSSFTMRSLIGSKKNLGDIETLTFADMTKLYNHMPKKGKFMINMTKEKFMETMLHERLEDYINWTTKEISFNSPEFLHLLEFANHFPQKIDENYDNQENIPNMVENGTLILDNCWVYGLDNIQMYAKMYKKAGGFQIVSYPSKEENTGLSIAFDGLAMAITKQCKEKNGAWEFIRSFLTYKNQKANYLYYGGMPTRKDVMEKALEYFSTTKKYTDEDGTIVTPHYSMISYDDNYTVELEPLTKKEVKTIHSILDRINKCIDFDTASKEIYNIIKEESQAYFAGDKTTEETAELIQSRVKLYVSENS